MKINGFGLGESFLSVVARQGICLEGEGSEPQVQDLGGMRTIQRDVELTLSNGDACDLHAFLRSTTPVIVSALPRRCAPCARLPVGKRLPLSLMCLLALCPAVMAAQPLDYAGRQAVAAAVARLAGPQAGPDLAAEAGAVMAGVGLDWATAPFVLSPVPGFVPGGEVVVEMVNIGLLLAQLAILTGARQLDFGDHGLAGGEVEMHAGREGDLRIVCRHDLRDRGAQGHVGVGPGGVADLGAADLGSVALQLDMIADREREAAGQGHLLAALNHVVGQGEAAPCAAAADLERLFVQGLRPRENCREGHRRHVRRFPLDQPGFKVRQIFPCSGETKRKTATCVRRQMGRAGFRPP